ncbi:MAG: DUF2029 domain-containing protein [Flavobacteriaceae bacterium]|nr:DUF2029 domain-containing protein [Flavobacteriaceae bacterium]
MLNYLKNNSMPLALGLLAAILYGSFAFGLVRSDFLKLISLYISLFFLTYTLIRMYGWNFWLLVLIGIVFRLVLLPSLPNLTQDFYRFLWDGQLVAHGTNPYLFTPDMFINDPSLATTKIANAGELFAGMSELNASHFSNYPPVNQLFFAISTLLGGKSIMASLVVMRALLILADLGILYFGKKLLEALNLPVKQIFWYFLNPFIIIELTGNLHFEGVMLFFLIVSLYLLHKKRWFPAAILFALSISVKLIPLIFLPLFYHYFVDKGLFSKGFWTLKKFFWTVIGTVVLTFLPFYSSEFVSNFAKTISLWFQDFEFNASVFYIIRWVGFQINGWDPIQTAGKILPIIVIVFVLALAFFRKNRSTKDLVTVMLFAISFYLLLSTTVHPWYVATPLLLCLFTKYRFPILWSGMVFLSYSAYGPEGFSENLWLVAIEYTVVIGFTVWEIFKKNPKVQLTS